MADQVSSIATSVTPTSPFEVGGCLRAALRVGDPEDPVGFDPLKNHRIQLPQVCCIHYEHPEDVDGGARGLDHAGAVRQWVEAREVAGGWIDQAYSVASFDQQLSGDVTHRWARPGSHYQVGGRLVPPAAAWTRES
jgi:hypothetical protein